MIRKMKKWSHVAVGVLFAGVFLYLALSKIDAEKFWACLRSVDLAYLGPILLTIAVFFGLKAVRWKYLLVPLRSENPLKVREVFPAMMIGFMGNNVLPAHLGEFVRMFVLGKQHKDLAAERIATIPALVALAFLLEPVGERAGFSLSSYWLTYGLASAVPLLAFAWQSARSRVFFVRVAVGLNATTALLTLLVDPRPWAARGDLHK